MAQLTCPQCGTAFEAQGAEFCPNVACGYPVAFMKPAQEDDTQAIHMERRPGEAVVAPPTPPPEKVAPTEVIPRVVVPPPAPAVTPRPQPQPPPPPRRNAVPFIIGGVAAAAVVAVVIFVVARSGGGTKPSADRSPTTDASTSGPSGNVSPVVQPLEPSLITASADNTRPPTTVNGHTLTYDLSNTLDGDLRSAWNDDDNSDSGIGVHLTYGFAQPAHVVGITLVNGYAQSLSGANVFEQNARLKDVTVTTSGGASRNITLDDTADLQRIDVDLGTTSQVVLTIDSVYPGSKYHDAGLTEIAFLVEG